MPRSANFAFIPAISSADDVDDVDGHSDLTLYEGARKIVHISATDPWPEYRWNTWIYLKFVLGSSSQCNVP
jgi:hypothetical protein